MQEEIKEDVKNDTFISSINKVIEEQKKKPVLISSEVIKRIINN